MAKSSIEKTNVMRLLDQKKVPYTPHTYPHGDDAVDGVTVAQMTGMDPAKVFKTLVARGGSKTPYVFVIPVACELDLKKAAKAVGEKSIAMLHVSELTPLTGLRARRLLAGRHEKAVSHGLCRAGARAGDHPRQRRQDRLSGRDRAAGSYRARARDHGGPDY